MTTEQKAKAYDEALKDIKVIYPNLKGDVKLAVEHAFPELKESEDEKIRKKIISIIEQYGQICEKEGDPCLELNDCLAYLEKQKEPENVSTTTMIPSCWTEKQKEQKPERINITDMVAKYSATDEYVEGEYKGKPVNCMIRAYEQGICDTLLRVKE